jgi:hypothetical protein
VGSLHRARSRARHEANFAGTSFLTTDKLGKFEFGSKLVNLVADKTQEGAMATCGYDDDGVKTSRWHLVKAGIFVDYQTTRDQAHLIGQKLSHGCSYADSWASIPFQRMPNVSLEPGPKDLSENDVLSATDDGVYVKGDGSYSIDHQRNNFQFSGQTFWEVKNGKITTQLRDLAYQSNTPDFWRSCDMVGGWSTYLLGGVRRWQRTADADQFGEPRVPDYAVCACEHPEYWAVGKLKAQGSRLRALLRTTEWLGAENRQRRSLIACCRSARLKRLSWCSTVPDRANLRFARNTATTSGASSGASLALRRALASVRARSRRRNSTTGLRRAAKR